MEYWIKVENFIESSIHSRIDLCDKKYIYLLCNHVELSTEGAFIFIPSTPPFIDIPNILKLVNRNNGIN